jgi:hypothetical protein
MKRFYVMSMRLGYMYKTYKTYCIKMKKNCITRLQSSKNISLAEGKSEDIRMM